MASIIHPDDLSCSIPGTYIVEGKNWPLPAAFDIYICAAAHRLPSHYDDNK